MRNLALAASTILLLACAPPPPKPAPPPTWMSYTKALTMMCDVDRLGGFGAEPDSIAVGQKRTAWIADKVDNPDAIELRTLMSVKAPKEQAAMLRREARDAKIANCALADALEKGELGGIAP